MGGFGSGGHNSKGQRIVEGQYWIDASDLKRRGLCRTGNVSHLYWNGSDGKKGPSLKKIADKHKGKADAEDKLIKMMTSSPKVKMDDGTEEEHKAVNTKDPAELKNLAGWILSH